MKQLIPMTDYVLHEDKVNPNEHTLYHTDWNKEFEMRFKRIVSYAKFLKQKPELWMFVACDDNNVPLVEPENWANFVEYSGVSVPNLKPEFYAYHAAKSRVLFDGILYSGNWKDEGQTCHVLTVRSSKKISFGIGFKNGIHQTLEDLAPYNLTLTETAIKQINGE